MLSEIREVASHNAEDARSITHATQELLTFAGELGELLGVSSPNSSNGHRTESNAIPGRANGRN